MSLGCNRPDDGCPDAQLDLGPFVTNDCPKPVCIISAGYVAPDLYPQFEKQVSDSVRIAYLMDVPMDSTQDRVESRFYELKSCRPFTKDGITAFLSGHGASAITSLVIDSAYSEGYVFSASQGLRMYRIVCHNFDDHTALRIHYTYHVCNCGR